MPEFVVNATIAPLATERHFLLIDLNVRYAGMTAEQVEAMTEMPSVPRGISDVERAKLAALDAYDARFKSYAATRKAARRARRFDANCVDAYVAEWLMAGEDSVAAMELARTAQELAVDRLAALDRRAVPEGDLWKDFRHRPIVRAHAALALTRWAREERDEAISLARDILALNPGDNLGMRWHLSNWYLTVGTVRPAGRLLRRYPDEASAPAAFATALVQFARSGARKKARRRLAAAQTVNAFLFQILQSPVGAIDIEPTWDYYRVGSWEEAVQWHPVVRAAWDATPGALEWSDGLRHEPDFVRRMEDGLARLVLDMADASGAGPEELIAHLREAGVIPDDYL